MQFWAGAFTVTFELSGRRRQDAKPGLVKMYRVPPGRAWWPAVGAPLEGLGVIFEAQKLGQLFEQEASTFC